MIQAVFFREKDVLSGFSIRGHAGFADAGGDVVCSSVSSAVQFAVNLITEGFKIPARVSALEDEIALRLSGSPDFSSAVTVLDALCQHLSFLAEDFPGTIQVTFSEG